MQRSNARCPLPPPDIDRMTLPLDGYKVQLKEGRLNVQWHAVQRPTTCAAQAYSTSSGRLRTRGTHAQHRRPARAAANRRHVDRVRSTGEQHEQRQTADMQWDPQYCCVKASRPSNLASRPRYRTKHSQRVTHQAFMPQD